MKVLFYVYLGLFQSYFSPWTCSLFSEKLKRYFRDYGIVQDAVVMKDPVTKRSRGFGFITFFDPLSVDAVLAAEPHVIDGRKVRPRL
jgi:RNA-binding protein Musashi